MVVFAAAQALILLFLWYTLLSYMKGRHHLPMLKDLGYEPVNDGVLIVVPAKDEEATIEKSIARFTGLALTVEIVAVNDGSSDRTGEILDRLAREGVIRRVIHHPKNRGKGAAVRSGKKRSIRRRSDSQSPRKCAARA